jgi:MFS transporter, DHA1 family, inner membrane transport protein
MAAAPASSAKLPGVLYWLAFGTFALSTDSFLIAGLLPDIAREFDIHPGTAGYLLMGFAFAYAIAAPIMATLYGRMDRRAVMLLGLGGFVVLCAAAALAPSYGALLTVRIVTACFTCVFTPAASALAASLVPPEMRGRALALVAMGLTVGPAVGVPLGTVIGDAFDWRTAFLADAALGAIAFAAVFVGVKRGFVPPAIPLRQRLAPLGQAAVVHALLVTVCWVAGAYTLYTFLAPYMAALGVTGAAFAGVLALFGAGAFAGNLMGGWASDRLGAPRVLVIGMGGLGLALLSLAVAPSLPFALPIALALLAVWSVLGFLGLAARQSQLIALAPPAAPLLLALNMSAMYLGVAAGATLGGITMAQSGPAELGYAGAAIEALALLFLALERRATSASRARASRAAAPAAAE